MTTIDIEKLIKKTHNNITDDKIKLDFYKTTYNAMKDEKFDTTSICNFINNKNEHIKKLENNIYAYKITLEFINKEKNSVDNSTDFSEIEEVSSEEVSSDEARTYEVLDKPSYAIVVSDTVVTDTVVANTVIANTVEEASREVYEEEIEESTYIQNGYNGEIITTFKSKIDGGNMKPFLTEIADIRNNLDNLNINNIDAFALVGTIEEDVYIIAENKGNGLFNTDLKKCKNDNKIEWKTNVPIDILEYVTNCVTESLHYDNKNNMTDDYNSNVTIMYVNTNVKNLNFKEEYKVYIYKWQ